MTKFITEITKPYFCLILHIFCESGTHSFIWVLNTMPKFRKKKLIIQFQESAQTKEQKDRWKESGSPIKQVVKPFS